MSFMRIPCFFVSWGPAVFIVQSTVSCRANQNHVICEGQELRNFWRQWCKLPLCFWQLFLQTEWNEAQCQFLGKPGICKWDYWHFERVWLYCLAQCPWVTSNCLLRKESMKKICCQRSKITRPWSLRESVAFVDWNVCVSLKDTCESLCSKIRAFGNVGLEKEVGISCTGLVPSEKKVMTPPDKPFSQLLLPLASASSVKSLCGVSANRLP